MCMDILILFTNSLYISIVVANIIPVVANIIPVVAK